MLDLKVLLVMFVAGFALSLSIFYAVAAWLPPTTPESAMGMVGFGSGVLGMWVVREIARRSL